MSYIGNTQQNQSYVPAVDFFNGNGSTVAFTLSKPVASVAQIQAVINNVLQKPGDAYTVSGSTITFTSAPPSGTNNIYVYYTSPNTQVIQPGQGTVGAAQIVDGAVTTAKLASTTGTGAVALASLPTFGTTIGVGGATASASGSGITFPATQSASSDPNTLDDYEEGTFTPVWVAASGSFTPVVQSGTYTRIGNLVHVNMYIRSSRNTASGTTTITGLPFASKSSVPQQRGYSVDWYMPGGGTAAVNSVVILDSNSTTITPCRITSASADATAQTWLGTDVATDGYLWMSFSYITA